MSDQPKPFSQMLSEATPSGRHAIRFLTASTIVVSLLLLCGLTLTGTVIALVVATPVLVLFSPILVPAVVVIFLLAGGFLVAGGCGTAALAAASWVFKYVAGKHPPGVEQLEQAKMRIAEKTKEYGQFVQGKGQEGNQG